MKIGLVVLSIGYACLGLFRDMHGLSGGGWCYAACVIAFLGALD